jgi:AcrR family transcriptional regulator
MARSARSQLLAAFRHAEILKGARRVFAQRGMRGASVDAIARVSGVAKGTIYLYYPSKLALYRAALMQGLRELHSELRTRMQGAAGPRAKVNAFLAAKLAFVETHADFLKMYSAAGDGVVPLWLQKDFKRLQRQQLALLREALPASRRIPRPLAAQAVFDLATGAVKRRLFGAPHLSVEREADALVALLFEGLGS